MTDYRGQLAQVLRAAAVISPTSYSWFGRRSRPLPKAVRVALSGEAAREYLTDLLESELYRSFYTQGHPVPASLVGVAPARPDRQFVESLSRANTGVGGWQPGWRVEAFDHRFLLVTRNGLRVRVRAADCGPLGARLEAGDAVSVRRPKEVLAASPGFYTALGDLEAAAAPEDLEVRIYFNVIHKGAAPLVASCTRLLNEAKVPFDLKVVDDPTGFSRCDPAVLYLSCDGYEYVRSALDAITSAWSAHLREGAPAFTKPLVRGIAVGVHRPQLGGSFGSSRCRLVAEGVIAAHECGADELSDRIDLVARRFTDAGLDIEAPYLAPGLVRSF